MKYLKYIMIFSYGVVILGGLILGLLYSFINEAIAYHMTAFGMSWQELSSNAQWMILNFERSAAAGFITTSLAMIFILVTAVKRNYLWSYFGVFIVALSEWLNILLRIISVMQNTVAAPPLTLNIVAVILIVFGFGLSLICYYKQV